MIDLNELKRQLPDLDLHPMQMRVAQLLLEGCTIARIAVLINRSERLVNLHVAAIEEALRRPPPDAAVTVTPPKSPRPSPLKEALALYVRRKLASASKSEHTELAEPNKRLQDDHLRATLFRGA